MNEIISVICPHCQERKMSYDSQKRAFECSKCVFRYSAEFFNEFKQFEKFVTRSNEIDFGRPIEVANGAH